jgi:hypothetical protein
MTESEARAALAGQGVSQTAADLMVPEARFYGRSFRSMGVVLVYSHLTKSFKVEGA